jgi:hypothetical protein
LKIEKFCVSLLCKEIKNMKNYRLSLKRTEMVNSGAYDGRFREKTVVDKKKKVNKEFARNKYSFNLLKTQ